MILNAEEFLRELEKINSFWLTEKVAEAEKYPFQRALFHDIEKVLENRRITILLGPRRTGKSTLLKQLIQSLIKKGVNPKSILYYSLDDPSLFQHSDNLIKDLLDYHEENIAGNAKRYILLDEIHSFPNWHKWIKSYYDRDLPLKFILSGSSSLTLQKEANKFLRGRSMEFSLYPLNFKEFLKLSGHEDPLDFSFAEFKKVSPLQISKTHNKIKAAFNEYLLVGGFPEWFQVKSYGIEPWFSSIVNDVPKKAIYEDIAKLFNIKNTRILEFVFTFIISNQSRILSYETINEVANLDRATLVNYIDFLKNSYLLIEILKFAGLKEQLKSMKKFLSIDQGLRNAILKDYKVKEENAGFIIENLIGLKCFALKPSNVFYWRVNGEIDFILRDKEILPIEVKYKNNILKKDFLEHLNFMGNKKLKKGIIITKDLYSREIIENKEIYFIPAWLFLLLDSFE